MIFGNLDGFAIYWDEMTEWSTGWRQNIAGDFGSRNLKVKTDPLATSTAEERDFLER
jgi:hypothetical protein